MGYCIASRESFSSVWIRVRALLTTTEKVRRVFLKVSRAPYRKGVFNKPRLDQWCNRTKYIVEGFFPAVPMDTWEFSRV